MSNEEKQIHKNLESKIDVGKPLVPQIKKLTNKEFLAFVKRPRYMESSDGIQLFETKEEDEKNKTDWHINIKVMTPIILAAMIVSYADCEDNNQYLNTVLIWFTWGLVIMWTLMEYIQHRFLLHKEVDLDPEAPWTAE